MVSFALCILVIVAALLHPGAGFEPLPLAIVGALIVVVRYYFE